MAIKGIREIRKMTLDIASPCLWRAYITATDRAFARGVMHSDSPEYRVVGLIVNERFCYRPSL